MTIVCELVNELVFLAQAGQEETMFLIFWLLLVSDGRRQTGRWLLFCEVIQDDERSAVEESGLPGQYPLPPPLSHGGAMVGYRPLMDIYDAVV